MESVYAVYLFVSQCVGGQIGFNITIAGLWSCHLHAEGDDGIRFLREG